MGYLISVWVMQQRRMSGDHWLFIRKDIKLNRLSLFYVTVWDIAWRRPRKSREDLSEWLVSTPGFCPVNSPMRSIANPLRGKLGLRDVEANRMNVAEEFQWKMFWWQRRTFHLHNRWDYFRRGIITNCTIQSLYFHGIMNILNYLNDIDLNWLTTIIWTSLMLSSPPPPLMPFTTCPWFDLKANLAVVSFPRQLQQQSSRWLSIAV